LDSNPTGTAACSFSAQVINQKSKGPASSRHCRPVQQAALFCWGSFPSPFTACLQFSQPSLLLSALLLTYLHISTGMPIFWPHFLRSEFCHFYSLTVPVQCS